MELQNIEEKKGYNLKDKFDLIKIKNYASLKDTIKDWISNPDICSQNIYLTNPPKKYLYLDYINFSYNSVIRKITQFLKWVINVNRNFPK